VTDAFRWLAIVAFTVAGVWLAQWFRRREFAALRAGDWSGASTYDIGNALFAAYHRGELDPRQLDAVARREPPRFFRGLAMNLFICLDVAAGRYQQALEWRARWKWSRRRLGYEDEVIRINEAEALACLGRGEEALAHAPARIAGAPAFVEGGLAAGRAWILAELGRVDEARAELSAHAAAAHALQHFEAEWHLSRFAVEFAARAYDAAAEALDDAERVARRESSKRNVHFLRGRLAYARGALEEAVQHFERGAQSVYQWQGGAALLDWGDALARLGREGEARAAWARCVERDGQAPAAVAARARLEPR
jgi:tetratricopeptide (TPR) repeat protein